jgi:hypothetical protein
MYIRISISAKSAASTPPAPEGADLERLHRVVQPGELGLRLTHRVRVALLLGELDQHAQVVDARLEAGEPVEVSLEPRQPAGDPLGVGLVVPQVGGGDLLPEVGDLGAHGVQVEHLLDGVHRRLELLGLGLEIGSCHDDQPYATWPAARSGSANAKRGARVAFDACTARRTSPSPSG